MRINISLLTIALTLLLGSSVSSYSQERPKLRPMSEKKTEELDSLVMYPTAKKELWGYADVEGKFIIRPVFTEVMPMSAKHVAFVSYINVAGKKVWTPLDFTRVYPTEKEFDTVVEDFDANGVAVVMQDSLYGVINHTGKMLAECAYTTYINRGSVFLFRNSSSTDWTVVAEDDSEDGASVYTFGEKDPIIVRSINGYGIISPDDQSVVADFTYDSVKEFVPGSIYCLQKDGYHYLYADDRLSVRYEEVIPGEDNAYFVVKKDGLYGVLTPKNKYLLVCSQAEVPVLKQDTYTRFYVNDVPVYVKVDENISAADYDVHLYAKYMKTPADYLLDTSLDFAFKQFVNEAIYLTYGTPDFDRIIGIRQAVEYADSRRFILLSNNLMDAKYLDLETGVLRDAGEIVYHAFPSKDGIPMYATVLRDGKFGIIDIRNRAAVVPCVYEAIIPVGNGYVLMYLDSSRIYLYDVADELLVTPDPCESVSMDMMAWNLLSLKQESNEKVYNIADHSWVLPEDHTLAYYVTLPQKESSGIGVAAFMKKDAKGALFSLTTGERLTDYLFDDISKDLTDGKYHLVTVDKKQGLYDVASKRYLLSCTYAGVSGYHKYSNNTYVVVAGSNKKCGVYNVTKKKLVLQQTYDAVDMQGGYARLKSGRTYKIYSFMKNDFMTIDTPFEYIELLDDGYLLMFTSSTSGIYDMHRNRWQFSFGSRKRKDFANGEFNDLGDDLLFIPGFGVLNYVSCKWHIRANLGWANWASRTGDYIEIRGGFEGETQAVYSLKRARMLMNYSRTYMMSPVVDSQNLKKDYILFHSYGKNAGNVGSGEYKTPSWLPWNDAEGGAGLYDIDAKSWLFTDEKGLCYFGSGLLYVAEKGVYDMTLEAWTLNTAAELKHTVKGDDLYVEEVNPDGETRRYWFDAEARALVPVSDSFGIVDYQALKKVVEVDDYAPKMSDTQWKLYDYKNDQYIPYGCDRISLMFE